MYTDCTLNVHSLCIHSTLTVHSLYTQRTLNAHSSVPTHIHHPHHKPATQRHSRHLADISFSSDTSPGRQFSCSCGNVTIDTAVTLATSPSTSSVKLCSIALISSSIRSSILYSSVFCWISVMLCWLPLFAITPSISNSMCMLAVDAPSASEACSTLRRTEWRRYDRGRSVSPSTGEKSKRGETDRRLRWPQCTCRSTGVQRSTEGVRKPINSGVLRGGQLPLT